MFNVKKEGKNSQQHNTPSIFLNSKMQRTEIGGKEIVEVFLGRGFTTHILSYTTRMAQWSEIIFKVGFLLCFTCVYVCLE